MEISTDAFGAMLMLYGLVFVIGFAFGYATQVKDKYFFHKWAVKMAKNQ